MSETFDFSEAATEQVTEAAGGCTLLHAAGALPGLLPGTTGDALRAIRDAAEGELGKRLGQFMGRPRAWAAWAGDRTALAEDGSLQAGEEA